MVKVYILQEDITQIAYKITNDNTVLAVNQEIKTNPFIHIDFEVLRPFINERIKLIYTDINGNIIKEETNILVDIETVGTVKALNLQQVLDV